MKVQVLWVSSKSDPPGQSKIWLEQVLTAIKVKEYFLTKLRSADPNKVMKDPSPKQEIPRKGADAREKQAKLLRDNVERVDVLQNNEKTLEAEKRTQYLLQRGAENIRALTFFDKRRLGCGDIEREFKDIVTLAKCFFQKGKKRDSRKVITIHA